jgi:hypothetical protein
MLCIGQAELQFGPRLIIIRIQKRKVLVLFEFEAVFFVERADAINERALTRIVWADQETVGMKLHLLFEDATEVVELNAEKFHVQFSFVVG